MFIIHFWFSLACLICLYGQIYTGEMATNDRDRLATTNSVKPAHRAICWCHHAFVFFSCFLHVYSTFYSLHNNHTHIELQKLSLLCIFYAMHYFVWSSPNIREKNALRNPPNHLHIEPLYIFI